MLMFTYGQFVVSKGKKENLRMVDVLNANGTSTKKNVSFKCTKIFLDHYNFLGAVDYHNKNNDDVDCGHGMSL